MARSDGAWDWVVRKGMVDCCAGPGVVQWALVSEIASTLFPAQWSGQGLVYLVLLPKDGIHVTGRVKKSTKAE